MISAANQPMLCLLLMASLPLSMHAADDLPDSQSSNNESETEPWRILPNRTHRPENAPAAAHLPGHALRASKHFTILADAPRNTVPEHESESGRTVFTPQAFLLFGRTFYAGAGIGTTYSDRRLETKPFVSFRTGLGIDLFGRWQIDISAQVQMRDSARDLRALSEDPDAGQLHIAGSIRFPF